MSQSSLQFNPEVPGHMNWFQSLEQSLQNGYTQSSLFPMVLIEQGEKWAKTQLRRVLAELAEWHCLQHRLKRAQLFQGRFQPGHIPQQRERLGGHHASSSRSPAALRLPGVLLRVSRDLRDADSVRWISALTANRPASAVTGRSWRERLFGDCQASREVGPLGPSWL